MQRLKQSFYNFLIWSQKFTKTDNIYLVKGGFWFLLLKVVGLGLSFMLAIVYANFLDTATFGNFKYLLSLASLLMIFSIPGIGTALIQAIARGFEGGFHRVVTLKMKYGILGTMASFSFALYFFIKGNEVLPIPLVIIGILFPFFHAFSIYAALLSGRKLFDVRAKYIALQHIISTLALGLIVIIVARFYISSGLDLILLTTAYFLVPTIIAFIFYNLIKKRFKPNEKEDPKTITYGKHLTVMGIIRAISQRLDQILVFHYLGAAQLAVYSFAIYPVEEINGFLDIIPSLAFPKFSARTREEIKKNIFQKIIRLFVLSFVAMAVYIFVAPYIFKTVFPQYVESIAYTQIFALFLIVTNSLPIIALESQLAVKERYTITIFSKVATIGFMLIFVIFYGIWGIIAGRILGAALSSLLSLWLVKKL